MDSDDYACECYKLHHMGQSCKFFCTECTESHDHYKIRDGVDPTMPPLLDDHEDGCVFEVKTTERKLTSILKDEVKALKKEVKSLERRKKADEVGLLGLREEQLVKRTAFLEREEGKEKTTFVEVLEVETKHDVEYPIIKRCWEDPDCDHHWFNHTCGCYKALGEAFMDFYGQSHEELLAAFDIKKWSAQSDLEVIKMELDDARLQGLPRLEVSVLNPCF